jgi:hypothetical protein
MKQATPCDKRRNPMRITALVAIGLLVIPLLVMNLTPGHLGFPDDDGCVCFVAYTTHASLPACDLTRPTHCDGLWTQQVLGYLSRFDLTK